MIFNNYELRQTCILFTCLLKIKPMKNIIWAFILIFAFTYQFSFAQSQPSKTIKVTYYADKFEGRKTSSGERFSQKLYTAAHHSLPFNTILQVTNLSNGKIVYVKVNDRCPRKGILDLSKTAAKDLGVLHKGMQCAAIEILDQSLAYLVETQKYKDEDAEKLPPLEIPEKTDN